MREVTSPVGTATDASAPTTARSSTSARSTTAAPMSPATGMKTHERRTPGTSRRSGRTNAGAYRPTKPMGPATVTAAAASSTEASTAITRVARTSTPRLRAASSPSPSASSRRVMSSRIPSATTTTGAICATASKPFWPMPPWPQR